MKIAKYLELTDYECATIENTVSILDKIIDDLMPEEDYGGAFEYLVDAMENGLLPHLIEF